MAAAFSKKVDQLSECIHKVSGESDLNRKALAAGELLDHAKELGAHTTRFARIAYCLDMLFLLFPVLIICLTLLFEAIKDVIPPELYQTIHSSLDSIEVEAFWLFVLGLVALPVVSDLILAVICRHTPVTAGIPDAAEGRTPEPPGGEEGVPDNILEYVKEKLRHVEETLDNVQNELNPAYRLPIWLGHGLSILFMIPVTIVTVYTFLDMKKSSLLELFAAVLAAAILFLLFLGFIRLLLWLKLFVLTLFFSSWKSRRQARKLRSEFSTNQTKYKEQCEHELWQRQAEELERQRLADLKEGAELYQKAVQGGTVDENLMVLAAEKGDPQANLHIGEQILMLVNDSGLTDREIAEFYEDARDYFKVAADAGIPDGIFWHAAAQLLTESHNEDGWMEILNRIRAIDKAKLSEACVNVYDMVVEQLVGAVNDAAARARERARRQQAEDAALWEEILKRPCKYSNGVICTRKSTPSFPHFCNGDGTGSNFCVEYAK